MQMVRKALLLALVLVFLAPSGPAEANTFGKAKFQGGFNMASGFGDPVVTFPPLAVSPPRTSGFSFVTQACVGTKSDVVKPKGTGTYGPNCTIAASGTVSGYCGLMQGTGTGWINYHGSAYKSVPIAFQFRIDGTKLTLTGTTSKGTLVGSAKVTPDPFGAGSCRSRTQARFLALGSMAFSVLHPPPAA